MHCVKQPIIFSPYKIQFSIVFNVHMYDYEFYKLLLQQNLITYISE